MFSLLPPKLVQLGEFKPPVENSWTDFSGTFGPLSTMETVISAILGILTVGGGLLFIYTFVMGAVDWITAGGDSGKVQKARDRMIQGAIGLIVLVMSYAIIDLLSGVLGFEILYPAVMLNDILPSAGS